MLNDFEACLGQQSGDFGVREAETAMGVRVAQRLFDRTRSQALLEDMLSRSLRGNE